MAELQTTYATTLASGYAGMIANGETSNRITRTNEDSAGIGFGLPVYRGSGDHGCTATVGTLATFLGWSIATSAQGYTATADADEYAQYDNVAILTSGAIYVAVKGAVTDGGADRGHWRGRCRSGRRDRCRCHPHRDRLDRGRNRD